MSMRTEHGREMPESEGRENVPAPGAEREDRTAAAERRAEASERLARAEAADTARETKERVADVLWEKPAAFAERVAGTEAGAHLARFLEAFSKLDDAALATEALRRARDKAAGPPPEGASA